MNNFTKNLPTRFFGLTIDTLDEDWIEETIKQLNIFKRENETDLPLIVRFVFDPGRDAEKLDPRYNSRTLKRIKDETGVLIMGEILDSFYVYRCVKRGATLDESIKSYEKRTNAYLKELSNIVDIWEIGNEVNGEWTGWQSDPSANKEIAADEMANVRRIVAEHVKAAYNILNRAGKKTALTLYFNDDGAGKYSYSTDLKPVTDGSSEQVLFGAEHSMFKWVENFSGILPPVDYVLVSYYQDDNFFTDEGGNRSPILPDANRWALIFKRFEQYFPNAHFGFGEIGPQCYYQSKKRECKLLDKWKSKEEERKDDCSETKDPEKPWQKRRCKCCLEAQIKYTDRYYLEWDKNIRQAIKALDKRLAEKFVGGYFYWQFNDDVINKFVYATDESIGRETRKKLSAEATAARTALLSALQRWRKESE